LPRIGVDPEPHALRAVPSLAEVVLRETEGAIPRLEHHPLQPAAFFPSLRHDETKTVAIPADGLLKVVHGVGRRHGANLQPFRLTPARHRAAPRAHLGPRLGGGLPDGTLRSNGTLRRSLLDAPPHNSPGFLPSRHVRFLIQCVLLPVCYSASTWLGSICPSTTLRTAASGPG